MRHRSFIALPLLLAALHAPITLAESPATPPTALSASQDVGQGVYELAYSARHHELYVAMAGDLKDESPQGKILVLDPKRLTLKRTILTPQRAFSLALDDAHDRLYVGNTLDASVTFIDTRPNAAEGQQVMTTLRLAEKAPGEKYFPVHPRELRLSNDGRRLYVTAVAGDGKLFVIDTQAQRLLSTVEHLGKWTSGLALDDQHQRIFVSNADGHVIVLSSETLTPIAAVGAGLHPVNIAYDARAQRLYAADIKGHQVLVMNASPATYPIIARLTGVQGPLALLVTQDRLYVTDREAGQVVVYPLASPHQAPVTQPSARYALPTYPNSLDTNPVDGSLFVSIKKKLHDDLSNDGNEHVARLVHPQ